MTRYSDSYGRSSSTLKPFSALIARFLLVSTFLEDAVRIIMQYNDQMAFLKEYRNFSHFTSFSFLSINVLLMLACSAMAMAKVKTNIACIGLMTVVLLQAIGYGLVLNFSFMLRNASLIGAVLMLLSESMIPARRKSIFPGLPVITERGKAKYITLMGRIMLICLFLSISFAGEMTLTRGLFTVFTLILSLLVIVGFKAQYSAILLLSILSVSNFILNDWWSLHHQHPSRDYLKYDFFQTMSVIGGLLLLVNHGPGGMSIDEKKKEF